MADTAAPAAPAAGGAAPARPPQNLDELMLAMDVVDTLRHQETLVTRELDESRREAELLERLRQIYRGQGIAVPDRVLQEGVQALKESRFVYTPPAPGLSRTLAMLWVRRGQVGRGLLTLLLALGLAAGAYFAAVVLPERQRVEQARIEAERVETEIGQRLPQALAAGHAEVLREAQVPEARERADRILADGRAALGQRNAEAARAALDELEALRAELRREYRLQVVSRPNEPTGVWRIPPSGRGRNYYLIVEPVAPDGRVLTMPVTSEEDGRTANASRWGVRVSEEVFNQIRRDKEDDGIVQQNRLGEKRRGHLAVDYTMPVLGGRILRW
jgi:hypothetical protein